LTQAILSTTAGLDSAEVSGYVKQMIEGFRNSKEGPQARAAINAVKKLEGMGVDREHLAVAVDMLDELGRDGPVALSARMGKARLDGAEETGNRFNFENDERYKSMKEWASSFLGFRGNVNSSGRMAGIDEVTQEDDSKFDLRVQSTDSADYMNQLAGVVGAWSVERELSDEDLEEVLSGFNVKERQQIRVAIEIASQEYRRKHAQLMARAFTAEDLAALDRSRSAADLLNESNQRKNELDTEEAHLNKLTANKIFTGNKDRQLDWIKRKGEFNKRRTELKRQRTERRKAVK
jgi:hypothetical protein